MAGSVSYTTQKLFIWLKNNQMKENPVGNSMLKVNNRNTRTRCEIFSKLTIIHWRRFGVFIVNFEYISDLVLVFLLLTLSRYMPTGNHDNPLYTECNLSYITLRKVA